MLGYTEVEKIRALALLGENHGDIALTSLQTNIPARTLRRWANAPAESLNTRLERLARELMATMPDKLEKADLQQLTRALTVVLSNLKREGVGAGDDQEQEAGASVEAYERIARLINKYHGTGGADGGSERVGGGGREGTAAD